MSEAKLSSKNQIVIPREAREALGIKAGDKLLIVVHGDSISVRRKPSNFRKALSGIAKGLYPEDYLRKERASWH